MSRGYSLVVMCRLLTEVASLTVELRLRGVQASVVAAHGFSSCGSWALEQTFNSCGAQASLLCSIQDLPRPGIEPMSPVLTGRFATIEPLGKPQVNMFEDNLPSSKMNYLFTQLWLTFCDPMSCSLPGSSVHGVLQAWILEWVAISFPRGSTQPREENPGLLHCRWTL